MTESLIADRRRAEIRELVTRWMTEREPVRPGHETCVRTIPASPNDVLWMLDELERYELARQEDAARIEQLTLQNEECGNEIVDLGQARESWSRRARGLEGDLETLRNVCRTVVERYGRVWAKDTDYYVAAEVLGIQEPPDAGA